MMINSAVLNVTFRELKQTLFRPITWENTSKRQVFCSLISRHLNKLCKNQSIICFVKYLLMTKTATFLFYFKMYILKSPQNLAKFTLIIQHMKPDTICRCQWGTSRDLKFFLVVEYIQFNCWSIFSILYKSY